MTAANIKKYALPYLPYLMLFWFFGKTGEAYRLAPGKDILSKMMGSMTELNVAMSNPMPSFNPMDMLVGLIGAATVFLIVLNKKKNAKNWRKDVEYGSARWSA
jgi:type IV secretion system protein VirD4